MKLSPRLQAIADWIEKGSRLADIGTDHGLLPVYCVLNGYTDYTVACDIREQPLLSARRNAALYGAEDRIDFLLSSGLSRVEAGSVDTIVAAGMGGETIIGILSEAGWIRKNDITLLLQPQSKIPELQQWLENNGFYTEKARLVKDSGRIYLILCVHWDGAGRVSAPYFLNLLRNDELLGEYASRLLIRTDRQLLAFRGQEDTAEKLWLTNLRKELITTADPSGKEKGNNE